MVPHLPFSIAIVALTICPVCPSASERRRLCDESRDKELGDEGNFSVRVPVTSLQMGMRITPLKIAFPNIIV